MKLLWLMFIFCLFISNGDTASSTDRVNKENQPHLRVHYQGWFGPGPGYPNQVPLVPLVPNNNLAIGYPTAYGLSLGFVRPPPSNNGGFWNGNGMGGDMFGNGYPPPPNVSHIKHNEKRNIVQPAKGTGFGSPLRCMNGGAHIGQCRLDNDAICAALGGGCISGSCCTTPFLGLFTTTTLAPDLVDGEITIARRGSTRTTATTESIDSDSTEITGEITSARRRTTKVVTHTPTTDRTPIMTTTTRPLTTTTPSNNELLERQRERERLAEIDELQQLLKKAKTQLPSNSRIIILTTSASTAVSTTMTTTTTTVESVTPPALPPWTEESAGGGEREEIDNEADEYESNMMCSNGIQPVGPCTDEGLCPLNYTCQRRLMCCRVS